MNSYLLNIKRIKDSRKIKLGKNNAGLISIRDTNIGEVVLDTDDKFRNMHQYAYPVDLLSFILDQGLLLEGSKTYAGNYIPFSYFPDTREVSGEKYNAEDFNTYFKKLNSLLSSNNTSTWKKGMRIANMLNIYNKARLLYPKYSDESYLSLLRILDFQRFPKNIGAVKFPEKVIPRVKKSFWKKIFNDISSNELYKKEYIPIALKMFKNKYRKKPMANKYKDDVNKFFYIILYSLYEYRSKFVHDGFPFPSKIQDDKPFGISVGELKITKYNSNKGKVLDTKDIHQYLNKYFEKGKGRNYKHLYLLLPTWNFLNLITREVIYYHLNKL